MQLSRKFFSGNAKYLFGFVLLMFVLVICAAFTIKDTTDFDIATREVLLRKIGHELLLQSGDNKSRVLPVKKLAENKYQISFEQDFAFQPDSLVKITRHVLAKDPLSDEYVVNVLNCANLTVAHGYAISKNRSDDVLACTGRQQPKACYVINVTFKPSGMPQTNKYLLGGLPFLAIVGFIYFRSVRPRKSLPEKNQNINVIMIGSVLFDAGNRKLIMNGKTIDLTATETRILHIFALSPNQTVERIRLQKEIWEDEGVIVGRSLDMFVSKLRKKLESDSSLEIVVVRGKGYKLEINA